MGWTEVGGWIRALLLDEAGFSKEEADRLASRVVQEADAQVAIGLAAALLATPRAPGGHLWWSGEGQALKRRLLEGAALRELDPDGQIGEAIEPAPDEWDPNWPDYKRFWAVSLPDGAQPGSTFVVGSGWGVRGRFVVVEREGRLGAELVEAWDVTISEQQQAGESLRRLLAGNGA